LDQKYKFKTNLFSSANLTTFLNHCELGNEVLSIGMVRVYCII